MASKINSSQLISLYKYIYSSVSVNLTWDDTALSSYSPLLILRSNHDHSFNGKTMK